MSPPGFRRYHALDALRAAMMLLGLVLHSGVSYMTLAVPAWRYHDPQTHVVFDLLVFFIHLFRMPVFFVVAGFFAGLLWHRDGLRGFVRNRIARVLLPLVLFWPMVYPPTQAGFMFANGQVSGAADWSWERWLAVLGVSPLAHLWFLYYLLLFYAATVAIVSLAARLPHSWRSRADGLFGRLATTITGALSLSMLTGLTLLPMTQPALDTSSTLLPPLRILVAYFVFFAFGLALFRRRDLIEPFGAGWKTPLAVGVLASVAYLVVLVGRHSPVPLAVHVAGCILAGLSIWMLIFGIMGAFVSGLDRPRPLVRYLSDAAYWMYIVHLPFAIWIPGLLATSGLPAVVKFAIVLSVTTIATVVSYHYLVRSTAIGALLNGRRYSRVLPRATSPPSAAPERAAV